MEIKLTDQQLDCGERARQFAAAQEPPWADKIDQKQDTPDSILAIMKSSGYLGVALPTKWRGGGIDSVSYIVATEKIGKPCSSLRSLITVHNMSAQTLCQRGSPGPAKTMATGFERRKQIIVFALSEPNVGSAADTIYCQPANRWIVDGTYKRHIRIRGSLIASEYFDHVQISKSHQISPWAWV